MSVRHRIRWDRVRDWAATVPVASLPVVLLAALTLTRAAAGPTLEVDPAAASAGMTVAVQGSGLDPGERGVLAWDGTPVDGATYRASGHGAFTIALVVPVDADLGSHEISAVRLHRGHGAQPARGSAPLIRATAELLVVATEARASAPASLPAEPPSSSEPTTAPGSISPSPTSSTDPGATTPATPVATPISPGTASPTASPVALVPSSPPSPTSPACPASLQAAVDGASPGSTLVVAACVFRETVEIKKPLTITSSGAKIDGESSRKHAFVVGADDVTIEGFEITATVNPAQDGAVRVRNSDRFTLRNSHIHHTGGACISVAGGSGHRIIDNELAYCEQEGFHLPSITDTLVARNRIHHNNPNNAYSSGWEAGAGKVSSGAQRVTFEDNDVYENVGFGLWSDYTAGGIVMRGNRVHHNTRAGIHVEISTGALIENNVVWENGWGHTTWGWGAGIIISSSRNVEVRNNVVAWNGDGIAVMSQNRGGDANVVSNVYVHHNTVAVAPQPSDGSAVSLLAWQQDWAGVMYDPASNNRGAQNRYWHANPEPGSRFEWSGTKATLSAFNETPGEEGGVYLTLAERDAVLSSVGIPLNPIAR